MSEAAKDPGVTAASPPEVTAEHAPKSPVPTARPEHPDVQQIGVYRILEKIGEGEMGVIGDYAAATLGLAQGVAGIFAPTNVALIQAMCQYRSGEVAKARVTYRSALGRLNTDLQRLEALPNAQNLTDYMICQCLKREAEGVISGKATTQPGKGKG